MRDETSRFERTLDGTLTLFGVRDLNSASVCQLAESTEFKLGMPTEFEGRRWIEAQLPQGTSGFSL
jgi:hypothetical protein